MNARCFAAAILFLLLWVGSSADAAQPCRTSVPSTAPDSRFTSNSDGTVSDAATGLTWKRCLEGQEGVGCATGTPQSFTWQQALQHARNSVFAGSSLWRLPNKNELESLVERRCYNPAINLRLFPNDPGGLVWTSSPGNRPGAAWVVLFDLGMVSYGYDYYGGYFVRLVRDGYGTK